MSTPHGEKPFTYHPNLRNVSAYRDNYDAIFRKDKPVKPNVGEEDVEIQKLAEKEKALMEAEIATFGRAVRP